MSDNKFRLEVVTPTRHIVSEGVEEITAPGIDGEFGVLLGHTPYLTELGVGLITFRIGSEERFITVRHGFAEVTREKVTVLAEEAEYPSEIDLNAAEAMLAEAEAALQGLSQESKEYLEAQGKLERAINQVQAVKRIKR